MTARRQGIAEVREMSNFGHGPNSRHVANWDQSQSDQRPENPYGARLIRTRPEFPNGARLRSRHGICKISHICKIWQRDDSTRRRFTACRRGRDRRAARHEAEQLAARMAPALRRFPPAGGHAQARNGLVVARRRAVGSQHRSTDDEQTFGAEDSHLVDVEAPAVR